MNQKEITIPVNLTAPVSSSAPAPATAPTPTTKYKAPKWRKNTGYLVWDNAKQKESFCKTKHELLKIKK